MGINVRVQDSIARMTMSGRFDFQMHREFKEAYTPLMVNDAVREIEIEMGKVDYIDSSALGMLMLLNERAKVTNKSVTLLNPSGVTSQALKIAYFDRIFQIRHAS